LVLRIGSIKAGKATIQGYVIQDCHGREDFIDEGISRIYSKVEGGKKMNELFDSFKVSSAVESQKSATI
jgi:hypothetical protein